MIKFNKSELSSGMMKSSRAIEYVRTFAKGQATVKIGKNEEYRAKRRITSKSLTKGMKVAASYNKYNQGFDIYEIIGFTGSDEKYGEGGVKFDSAKELLKAYGVKNFKQLEALQDENEYGCHSYLEVRDLNTGEQGPWFYLFEGRWSLGSGAEALSFVEVEEFDQEAYDAEQEAKAEADRRRIVAKRIDINKRKIAELEAEIAELETRLK